MTFPGHLRKEDYPEAYAQKKDPRYSRFMAYISLFATGMLGLVVSNSLLTFFVFWEIMGFCSYLLISFWYEKPTAKRAGFKAFMTTRVGDTIMFVGMMLLYIWSVPSTLVFRDILSPENLHQLSEHMVTVPLLGITAPAVAIDGGADLLWHHRQERPVPAARVAARCHGRPYARQRHDSCGDDGVGWCIPGGAYVPPLHGVRGGVTGHA